MSQPDKDMPADVATLLQSIREKRNFVASDWIQTKVTMFNEYMGKNGLSAAVVSVSGGIDSAVTFALCLEASRKEGSPIKKIVGVAQPIHSTDAIWKRGLELKDLLLEKEHELAKIVTVDQTSIYDQLKELVDTAVETKGENFASGQLRSYMRTPVGYYTAQLVSQSGTPAVVMGTGNMDEDGYLAYFCKAGDGVVDVQLISDLHKSEVFAVGKELKVPESILAAAPSADLWDGQTDEDELGFSYDFIELFTELLAQGDAALTKAKQTLSADSLKWFETRSEKAEAVHRRNAHKLDSPKNLIVDALALNLQPAALATNGESDEPATKKQKTEE